MKLSFATACTFFVFGLAAYGQERITVRMVDQLSKEPLAQASARVLDDTIKATTNEAGYLQINASPGDSLVLTAPGYLTGAVVVPEVVRFQASLAPVDSLLAFEGGIKSFYRQLGETLWYPRLARTQRLQGVTYTSFTIDEAGNIIDIRSLTSRPSPFHRAVIQALEQVEGQWDPTYQGQIMTLPVVFKVERGGGKTKPEVQTIPGRLLEAVTVVAYSR